MAEYEVIWSSKYGQGSEKYKTASLASAWIDEFRDKGADAIVIIRDGVQISEAALLGLITSETAAHQAAQQPAPVAPAPPKPSQ